jgi:hypothetical protein
MNDRKTVVATTTLIGPRDAAWTGLSACMNASRGHAAARPRRGAESPWPRVAAREDGAPRDLSSCGITAAAALP